MSTSDQLRAHLPYLRRYARALTGNQKSGDAFVTATLEAAITDPESLKLSSDVRVSIYQIFSSVWKGANVEIGDGTSDSAQGHLSKIPPVSRQVLLLTALEGFSLSNVAQIVGIADSEAEDMLEVATADMDQELKSDVLIIEDDALISMELSQIVTDLGHNVCGTATTHKAAVKAMQDSQPTLVLADIQLADGSSGIDAVKEILEEITVPVIFITAFPERLLTGERPEPTFLITKPFQEMSIRAAISQALFFAPAKTDA